MRVLLDTHLVLWAAEDSDRQPAGAAEFLSDPDVTVLFSVSSLWEVAIKASRRRDDFDIDAGFLRRGLLDGGWHELPVLAEHAVATASLPPIHGDPFDRMLVAQATVEGALLLTADRIVARYPGPVRLV